MIQSVSVITVTYNNKEGLEKTLCSIIDQTFENMQVYVIDGASQDGTLELLDEYEKKFKERGKKLKYISEKDSGIYDAMNKGIDLAEETWAIFMNAGDIFYNERTLERVLGNDISEDVDIIYGRWKKTIGNRTTDGLTYYFDEMKGKYNIKGLKRYPPNGRMITSHQAIFFKTTLLKARKYNLNYKIIADLEWVTWAYKTQKKFVFVDEFICLFDGSGKSSQEVYDKCMESVAIRHLYGMSDNFIVEKVKIVIWYIFDRMKRCINK